MRYTPPIAQTAVITGLTVLASLSPLLTFGYLWQLKEWRWVRLWESLRRENPLLLLMGRVRPPILLLYALSLLLGIPPMFTLISALGALACLTVVQITMDRQPCPVWTQKAKVLVGSALLLTVACALLLQTSPLGILASPFLALVQPLLLALAWMTFWPVDLLLKRRVMQTARRIRHAHPGMTVMAVTGSVGKTTTKELLAHVLGDFHPLATPAHVNSEVGIAQWMARELPKHVTAHGDKALMIVEMGAYRKGEIALMSSYVGQTIGVVTYVGSQHLALFGSQQALFDAKSELVEALPTDGHAFLNGDNELCRKMAERSPCPVTIIGTGGSADLEAYDIQETPQGIRCIIKDVTMEVPIHGTHNVSNVLLATAVAMHMGMDLEAIRKKLQTFRPPSRTFEVRNERGVRLLDDTHNSSVASVKAAIAWARIQPYEKKILLATGLIELGEEQERAERELGAFAAPVFTRAIVLDPRSAAVFAQGFGKPVEKLTAETSRIESGSLLVCVGKMQQSTIQRLLPAA